jgi:hypothetical protein
MPFWHILFPERGLTNGSVFEHFIFSPGKLTKRCRGKMAFLTAEI